MFLRNANRLRITAIVLLVLLVNLAGMWPLVSQQAARSVDLFQRYSEFMTLTEALDHALGDVEFCGELPTSDEFPTDWSALPSNSEGKLILLSQAPGLPIPTETLLALPREEAIPGLRAWTPETPPPQV
ncbi:hypothetical protein [Cerasicoccus arenae]|uniref:Uncharacterized protein n=1 Tax=Cerasicoccus arenae TaxID=424488 RepID=A0A8J3GEI8_9BACT|nr:hypothetical protein [Cerasicoccus arenae]MBK1858977.1 hypothetical protein [Cerasicoccus arenae]GHC04203.1 hypothetical protein GCM10007047_21120 [Cerasicoccus arenae]